MKLTSSMMLSVLIAGIFLTAHVPGVQSLTEECSKVAMPCVLAKITAPGQGMRDCEIGQTYAHCVDSVLRKAESDGTCDKLALLSYRVTQEEDINSYHSRCVSFVVPAYLILSSDCERTLAQCGNFAVNAFFDQQDGDLVSTCRNLVDLQKCMDNINANVCPDQQEVQTLLQKEMRDRDFNTTCVGTTTSTTTAATTTTTTTTETATATGRPVSTGNTIKDDPVNGGRSLTFGYHTALLGLFLLLRLWFV